MSLTQKIAKNTIFQMSGKIFGSTFALIAIALMTRYLGPEEFGKYTTVLAFLQIFGILVDLGLTLITVQMISEKGADIKQTLDNIFTFRLLTAFVFLGIAPMMVIFFPYPEIVKLGILIGATAFFFNAINQVLIGLFQKELKMQKVAIAEIFNRLVFLILISIAIFLKLNLLTFIVAMAIGNFVNFIVLFLYSRKIVRISLRVEKLIWKKIISRSWPIAAGIGLNLIYLRADMFLLSLLKPVSHVGFYGVSYKLIDALTSVPYVFIGLVLPSLTLAWSSNEKNQFRRIVQKSFDALILLIIPVVTGGIILAKPIIQLFAGVNFLESARPLQILMVALLLIFPTTLFTHIIIAIKKQKLMLWGFGTSALLSVAGYLIFIPRYSYIGAAWVTVFSEFLIFVFSGIIISKYIGFFPELKKLKKSLIGALVMSLVLLASPIKNIFFLILAGMLIYFVILYITKGITKGMIKEITSLR